jgi:hypothetical protein
MPTPDQELPKLPYGDGGSTNQCEIHLSYPRQTAYQPHGKAAFALPLNSILEGTLVRTFERSFGAREMHARRGRAVGAMAATIDQAVRKLMSIEQIRRRITLRIYADNVQKFGEARPVKSTNWGAWFLKFILMVSADCEPHI